eukprot:1157655-Pelagomonas_calceolata.AAC.4
MPGFRVYVLLLPFCFLLRLYGVPCQPRVVRVPILPRQANILKHRWLTNLAGLAIMSLMGEWLCVRREMSDIPISSLRARGAGSSTQMSTAVSGGLKRSDSKSRLLGGPNNV